MEHTKYIILIHTYQLYMYNICLYITYNICPPGDIYLWEPQPLYVFLDLSHDQKSGSERLTAETGATGKWCSLPL